MRSIKKLAGRLLLAFVVLFLFDTIVEFLYRPYNRYTPYAIRELKECQGKIDTLFLGTSTAYRGFAPDMFDRELGTFSFNAATASQPVSGTFSLLKDQAARNPVKRVFLGVSPRMLVKEEAYIERKAEVYDRLLSLKGRLFYLAENCTSEEWMNMVFYSVRVDKFFDIGKVKKNLNYKLSDAYQENKAPMATYMGKGFLAGKEVYEGQEYETIVKGESTWKVEQENQQSLIEMIKYCKENEIELILVFIPLSGAEINGYKDIGVIHDYFLELADKYGAIFWDFNYYKGLKEEFPNGMFQDKRHLNGAGGYAFTSILAEVYEKHESGEEIDGYFLQACPYYENFH